MSIYEIEQWIKDIDRVSGFLPELSSLSRKTILVTGAAGLVCSSIVFILVRFNETHEEKIQIAVAGRWVEEMEERFGELVNKEYFHFVQYDASKMNNDINISVDYIIHGASNASPNMIVKEPVETLMGNVVGLKCLFDYAKEHGTSRILYISSSEVYGQRVSDHPLREDEYGYINILNSRNSYSIGKCAAETLCVSYGNEYGVESVIVRPGHIFGPTASEYDTRVGSAWAYAVAKGEDLVMKSDGSQIRSYVYCLDCASAMLKVLLNGDNGHAYNISNPASIITIRELGEKLSIAGGVRLRIERPEEEEKKGFNPMKNSSLAADKLLNLGWRACFNAEEGLSHTVEILRDIIHDEGH